MQVKWHHFHIHLLVGHKSRVPYYGYVNIYTYTIHIILLASPEKLLEAYGTLWIIILLIAQLESLNVTRNSCSSFYFEHVVLLLIHTRAIKLLWEFDKKLSKKWISMARSNQYTVSEAQSQCNDNEPPTVTSTEQVSYTCVSNCLLHVRVECSARR